MESYYLIHYTYFLTAITTENYTLKENHFFNLFFKFKIHHLIFGFWKIFSPFAQTHRDRGIHLFKKNYCCVWWMKTRMCTGASSCQKQWSPVCGAPAQTSQWLHFTFHLAEMTWELKSLWGCLPAWGFIACLIYHMLLWKQPWELFIWIAD